MAAPILQLGCTIQCPHGGLASVANTNTRVRVGGSPALLATDVYTIAGCSFNISGSPHPCVAIEWQATSQRVKVNGSPVLLSTSIGLCKAGDQAPQGAAMVSGIQQQVTGA
jgi:hypothetical protein